MDLHAENRAIAPRLETARLTLRSMVMGDADAVVAALNDWSVTQWLTQVPYPYSADDFAWFLNTYIPENDHLAWAIDAGDGMIGTVGVRGELGYWLARAHHGKGIVTEAATAACDWHFAQTDDDLTSGYHLGNGPSARVLQKLGFRDTHIDHGVATVRGERVDIQRMALCRAVWMARDA